MPYSVSEIARIFGTTKGGIRFFEEEELVHPERRAGGSRVYGENNIIELFYLHKYCNYGLTIKEISRYFMDHNDKELEVIGEFLETKRQEAEQKARYNERVARWIGAYAEKIKTIDVYMEAFRLVAPPDQLILTGNPLAGKSAQRQEALRRWIAAAPLSKMIWLNRLEEGRVQEKERTAILVDKTDAEDMALPIPGEAKLMRTVPTLHKVIKLKSNRFEYIPDKVFEDLGREAAALGHVFRGYINAYLF